MPYIFVSADEPDDYSNIFVHGKDIETDLLTELQPIRPQDDTRRGFRVCDIFDVLDKRGYQVVGQTAKRDHLYWTFWKPCQEETPTEEKEDITELKTDEPTCDEKKKEGEKREPEIVEDVNLAASLQPNHSHLQQQLLKTTPTAAPIFPSADAMAIEQEIPRPHDADLQLVKEIEPRWGTASAWGLGVAPIRSLPVDAARSAQSSMIAAPLYGSSKQFTAPVVSSHQPQKSTVRNGIAGSAPAQGAHSASSVALTAASQPYSSVPYSSRQMTQLTAAAMQSAQCDMQQQIAMLKQQIFMQQQQISQQQQQLITQQQGQRPMQQQPLMTGQQTVPGTVQFEMGTARKAAPYFPRAGHAPNHSSLAAHAPNHSSQFGHPANHSSQFYHPQNHSSPPTDPTRQAVAALDKYFLLH